MSVNAISNQSQTTNKRMIKNAFEVAAITTAIQGMLLPAEVKAAAFNTAIGKDLFLKNTEKAAVKTIKNLTNAGKEKMAAKIDVQKTLERANQMYPKITEVGKPVLKELGKTFIWIAGSVVAGKYIADKLFANKTDSAESAETMHLCSRYSTTA